MLASVGPQGLPMYQVDANGQKTQERIIKKEDINFSMMVAAGVEKGDREPLKQFFDGFITTKPADDVYKVLVDESMMQKHISVIDGANLTVNMTDEDSGVSKGDGMVKKVKCKTLVIHGEQDNITYGEDAKNGRSFWEIW